MADSAFWKVLEASDVETTKLDTRGYLEVLYCSR